MKFDRRSTWAQFRTFLTGFWLKNGSNYSTCSAGFNLGPTSTHYICISIFWSWKWKCVINIDADFLQVCLPIVWLKETRNDDLYDMDHISWPRVCWTSSLLELFFCLSFSRIKSSINLESTLNSNTDGFSVSEVNVF